MKLKKILGITGVAKLYLLSDFQWILQKVVSYSSLAVVGLSMDTSKSSFV
ncbi:hypothetical protein PND17_09930 [Streptococcus thermophilus]|nr:hypothetical protein [Streptococcus thermophilus]WCL60258.1 hypothetical protein PND17_09930 [Streptococcus thermophilus]